MKNAKKLTALLLTLIIAALAALTGCQSSNAPSDSGDASGAASDAKKVGIIQFMPHSSLDNCCKGLKNVLDAKGVKYDVQVGSSASAVDDCQNYAAQMASSSDYDLIIAIATPAATAAYSAVANASSDKPVIFCAVSDPVSAKLVNSTEAPGNNCTGTCDTFDIPSQVKMIKAFQPALTKLGVLYTSTEPNSISQLKTLRDEAAKVGIEIVDLGINDATELPAAVANLLPRVEAVTNLTDNNVVDNMATLLEQAKAAKIPVYGSEIEQVKKGCIAAASLDYVSLGEKTADLALSVRGTDKAAETPVLVIADSTPVVNTDVMTELNISLPADYASAEKVVTATAE